MEPENHTLRLLMQIRDRLEAFEAKNDARFDAIDARFDANDGRFDAMDRRMDVLEDIARDTAARVRMNGRMLRNLDSSKRKHAGRIDALERRVDALEKK